MRASASIADSVVAARLEASMATPDVIDWNAADARMRSYYGALSALTREHAAAAQAGDDFAARWASERVRWMVARHIRCGTYG